MGAPALSRSPVDTIRDRKAQNTKYSTQTSCQPALQCTVTVRPKLAQNKAMHALLLEREDHTVTTTMMKTRACGSNEQAEHSNVRK